MKSSRPSLQILSAEGRQAHVTICAGRFVWCSAWMAQKRWRALLPNLYREKNMKTKSAFAVIATVMAVSGAAHAAVVDSANVAGLKTFTDTNTGRVWLDLDNFFDSASATTSTTPASMMTAAAAAGFTLASGTDLHQLLDSLPLSGGEYSSYAAVMGSGQPRQLIWGLYGQGDTEVSGSRYAWAYAFAGDSSWNFSGTPAWDANSIPNSAGNQDLGVWAFQTAAVPEPSTYAMLLAGLGMLGFTARRRQA